MDGELSLALMVYGVDLLLPRPFLSTAVIWITSLSLILPLSCSRTWKTEENVPFLFKWNMGISLVVRGTMRPFMGIL